MKDSTLLSRIDARSVREQVYETLRQAILDGHFAVGENLPERELAESLGISRTPLREALVKLEQEGLVEIRPYRGVIVSGITREEFSDMMQVREVLEAFAVRLAADRVSDEELQELRDLFEKLRERIEQGDVAADVELNNALHSKVAYWSGNDELEKLITNYEQQVNHFVLMFRREPRPADILQSYCEHCQLLDALAERDGERAAQIMVAHIRDSSSRAAHMFPAKPEGFPIAGVPEIQPVRRTADRLVREEGVS